MDDDKVSCGRRPAKRADASFYMVILDHVVAHYTSAVPAETFTYGHSHHNFSLCNGMLQLRVKAATVLLPELHQNTVGHVPLLTGHLATHQRERCANAQPTRLSLANTARRR